MEASVELAKSLCSEFHIPMTSLSHNTKIDNLSDFNGVLYKSNLDKQHTDLSPAWDCKLFKNKLEEI